MSGSRGQLCGGIGYLEALHTSTRGFTNDRLDGNLLLHGCVRDRGLGYS